MPKPIVSILIDTYNHERFIGRAIKSVLVQDFHPADREIVVVDDGSTDKTREILRVFEPEIRVIDKPNGGQASAFNVGIRECNGNIIAFLDGDDWWVPGKLTRVVKAMCDDPLLGAIGHGFAQVSENGSQHNVSCGSRLRFRLNSSASAEIFRVNRCYFGTSRLALRADVARRILPVPESLVFEADEYLFTLAPVLADAIILPDLLTGYRVHGTNLFLASGGSRSGERRKQRILTALARELREVLLRWGVPAEVSEPVVEIVELEAAQLRLSFDGGLPLETYRTETSLYRILHPRAPYRSKAFRALTMIPALALPPRWFYAARRWLASQRWYLRARKSVVPSPAFIPSIHSTSTTELSRSAKVLD